MDDRHEKQQAWPTRSFAAHPTVYAADALKDQVASSRAAPAASAAPSPGCSRGSARMSSWSAATRANSTRSPPIWPARGLKASAYAADIREPDAVNALFEKIWAAHGRLDILVNSAGGQFPQAAIDFSIKGLNAVINTNLNGTWYMMQAAAQRWRDRKHPGSIVNIVVVTTHGLYGIAHTIAARSGVIGLSRAVAVEWAPLNIRVNCVAPGAIETEGWKVYKPEAAATYPRSNPMMRAGSPWDIAEACVYLAGPSGKFVTGETLTVDGGGQLWGETWTTGKPEYFGGDG